MEFFIVKLFKDISSLEKPNGIPDNWIAEMNPYTGEIPNGYTIMSDLEIELHKEMHLPEYQAWEQSQNQKSLLQVLEETSPKYRIFGSSLYLKIVDKTWAFNTYLKSVGTPLTINEMQTLLNHSTMLEKSLNTGSLLTAKDVANQLKTALPSYSTIADYAINEIDKFLTGG